MDNNQVSVYQPDPMPNNNKEIKSSELTCLETGDKVEDRVEYYIKKISHDMHKLIILTGLVT